MIVSFTVGNFRSFDAEATLNLVASKKLTGSHPSHAVPLPGTDESVLKTAVIYGANGAGKSNLFKGLNFLRDAVLTPRSADPVAGTGREPFKFGASPDKPSFFDLTFVVENKIYRYAIRVDDDYVVEEWLSRINGKKEVALFERVTDFEGKVTVEADSAFSKQCGERFKALCTVGGLPHQTFMATVVATLGVGGVDGELGEIFEWFRLGLRLIEPNSAILPVGHYLTDDEDFRVFSGEFLRSSSTGVDHLEVQKDEISEDDLRKLIPEQVVNRVLKEFQSSESQIAVLELPNGSEVTIERSDANHFYLLSVKAAHRTSSGRAESFSLNEESDGTRRLLNLIPALHKSEDGGVYFIDEIDRSLHPMLIWKYLDYFLSSCEGAAHQIIVTTHESNLLDLALLRRDEIWFAEKDASLATQLYSLADFKVRNDLQVRKHYLQGRFGAVPFLGRIDNLIDESASS
ncbi:hypothetical protein LMG18101_04666 [Ralstonia flaminis]|uniref:ATPase AAA-type core domain-containing protein n=2 Tax=Ralstonia flaminis TaxID=3058597 RepID=A0ABN9JV69_9RALS|nr:hypothetical protein LMG18101_04666 [Ralstonia sp. LMG 18101]